MKKNGKDYFKMGDLIEAYHGLLTKKQRSFLEMYYFNNYSIDEIAELRRITKQGVYDLLKRSEKRLMNYEEKIGLLKLKKVVNFNDEVLEALDTLKDSFQNKVPADSREEFSESIDNLKKKLGRIR